MGSAPYRCNSGFLLRAVAMLKLGRNARLRTTDGRQADAQEWCWFTLLTEQARVRQLHGEEGPPGSHSAVGAKLACNADHQKSTGREDQIKYKKNTLIRSSLAGERGGAAAPRRLRWRTPWGFGRLPRRASPSNQATLPALESQQNAHESGFWRPNADGLLCLERLGPSTKIQKRKKISSGRAVSGASFVAQIDAPSTVPRPVGPGDRQNESIWRRAPHTDICPAEFAERALAYRLFAVVRALAPSVALFWSLSSRASAPYLAQTAAPQRCATPRRRHRSVRAKKRSAQAVLSLALSTRCAAFLSPRRDVGAHGHAHRSLPLSLLDSLAAIAGTLFLKPHPRAVDTGSFVRAWSAPPPALFLSTDLSGALASDASRPSLPPSHHVHPRRCSSHRRRPDPDLLSPSFRWPPQRLGQSHPDLL